MKNYEAPELLSAGTISEVVLGQKGSGVLDDQLQSFPSISTLDID